MPPARPDTPARSLRAYWIGLAALLGLGVLRSSIATRLDGFSFDEPYHVVAGVSYVRTGDYRLNPEHPPLVKLWAGAVLSATGFHLPAFRPLSDKHDERHFTDAAAFLDNEPDSVQRRTRAALLTLSALLLALFAEAVRRHFGPAFALFALAFLVIDPTVAAHMPVAMTDLPVALLATTALLFALSAFRSWRPRDLALAGLCLGLMLGTKHSALVALLFVGLAGLVAALRDRHAAARRLVSLVGMFAVALVVLWGLYGFRFAATTGGDAASFNRPLEAKIEDLRSPVLRRTLSALEKAHALPRAYLWGLADTLRAGVEGRDFAVMAFGRVWEEGVRSPAWYFPGNVLVKVPLGLLALSAAGLVVALRRRFPREWMMPLGGVLGMAGAFLLALAGARSEYAGVRHALPVFPALAILAGLATVTALQSRSPVPRALVALAFAFALASAVPVPRPWEYFNALGGGTENAYRAFSNEGVDLAQRQREAVAYYRERLAPAGVVPYWFYPFRWSGPSPELARHYGIRGHWPTSPDGAGDEAATLTGTVFFSAEELTPTRLYDPVAFRDARPVARFGNLLVYQGSFSVPSYRASALASRADDLMKSASPDLATAERLMAEAVALYPQDYGSAIVLGNLAARRGDRAEAIRAFTIAKNNLREGNALHPILAAHLSRLAREAPESLPEVRDPFAE